MSPIAPTTVHEWMSTTMALSFPGSAGSATTDALAEGLGRWVKVVQMPMADVAGRLCWTQDGEPILYIDPAAPPEELRRVYFETLAVMIFGLDAAASARRVPHLRVVS